MTKFYLNSVFFFLFYNKACLFGKTGFFGLSLLSQTTILTWHVTPYEHLKLMKQICELQQYQGVFPSWVGLSVGLSTLWLSIIDVNEDFL